MKEFKVTERKFYPVHESDGTNLKVVFENVNTKTSITARFNVLLCNVKTIDKILGKVISRYHFNLLIRHAIKIESVSTK